MEMCYEEYSDDKKSRFRIYKVNRVLRVILEKYHEEFECIGYIEEAGFYEVRDNMIHYVGTIEEGIAVGRELMRNL